MKIAKFKINQEQKDITSKFWHIVLKPKRKENRMSYDWDILEVDEDQFCLLYTSPSPRDLSTSRMPSSA